MIKKVALFDFDNTVANGDSIQRLLKYDIQKHPLHFFYFIKVGILYLLYKLHLSSFEKAKSAMLFPLDYMNDEQLQMFYQQYVAVHYYPNVVKEMQSKKDEGYIVILCTASCESYMQFNQLPIDQLIGTLTKREHNHETSCIIGKNCKGKEKINRILDYLNKQNIEIDFENSYGYSDSNDDIPMLSLVKHKKRVLLKTGKIVEFKE